MSRRQSEYPYDDPDAQVLVFRVYQRLGTVEDAAAELGLTVGGVQKRLYHLYERIGARNAIQASHLLAQPLQEEIGSANVPG